MKTGTTVTVTMAQLTVHQRSFIIETWLKSHSVLRTHRSFQNNFGFRVSKSGIKKIIAKWREHSVVHNRNRGNSGRPKTVHTDENIRIVQDTLLSNSGVCSLRKISASSGINMGFIHRIIKQDLRLKAYKPHVAQKISETDKEKRLAFCNKVLLMNNSGELDVNNVIFSDESHIHLQCVPNRQNLRKWSNSKPDFTYEKSLHSPKVTVWCGLSSKKIFGPYFFENTEGDAVTVNKERYIEMLENLFPNSVDRDEWFQQDGATCHTATASLDFLHARFGQRLISNKTDFNWPPRSPDLSPLDFYLWGNVKHKVMQQSPSSLAELKERVKEVIAAIEEDELQRVIAEFMNRVSRCKEAGGGLFE